MKVALSVTLAALVLAVFSMPVSIVMAQNSLLNPIPTPDMLRLPPSANDTVASPSAVAPTVTSTTISKPTVAANDSNNNTTVSTAAVTTKIANKTINPFVYDKIKHCATDQTTPTNFATYLTHFACGRVHIAPNGTVFRDFTLIYDDYHGMGKPIPITLNKTDPVMFHAWTINGTVPGPTLRMTVDDHVRINVINSPDSAFTHNFHMHNIHPGNADGMMGPSGMIFPGANYTYSFIAGPAGNYGYHCHMTPTEEHINRGLYGAFIIDPSTPRQNVVEMVMTLSGFSFNWQNYKTGAPQNVNVSFPCTAEMLRANQSTCQDESSDSSQPDNQFYALNGMAFPYDLPHPIVVHAHVPYRIYLINWLEFEPVNSFHIHGQMFYFYESGTFPSAPEYTDTLILGQAQRGIIQLEFPYTGLFFFHSHISHQSDLGWQSMFLVER